MVGFGRRTLLAGAAGATLLGGGTARALARSLHGMPSGPMRFAIRVNGDGAGYHTLRFVRTPDGFDALGSTRIKVKVAFITAYRFSQDTEEHWQGGTWTRYRSSGAENGDEYRVEARRTQDGILLNGRPVRAAELMPASFWNPEVLESRQVIDPVRGTAVPQSVRARGRQALTLGGERVAATAYAVDNFLDGMVWYSPDGRWLAANFDKQGHTVEYVRTA
ncbi:DUF6134 family protein [Azospirillum sp. A39]|uniref:DUF6134 family protein n=1 Tax=Azospirillum sp. A39 TaxID=3462279 RepID=UPI0040456DA6